MPLPFTADRNRNTWYNHLPLKVSWHIWQVVGHFDKESLIQIANIVGAIFVMGGNVYTVISPLDVYYTGRETYFTPAPWSFFVWWVTKAHDIAAHPANLYPGL